MWNQQTGQIIPRLPERKSYLPKSNVSQVILHQNTMAKNTLQLTLHTIKNQRQWARRSLEGSRQAFILKKMEQEQMLRNAGIGHMTLLPQDVSASYQSLLAYRTSQNTHRPSEMVLSYRMQESPRSNKGSEDKEGEPTPEQRENVRNRRQRALQKQMNALISRQDRFFDSISGSDGIFSPRASYADQGHLETRLNKRHLETKFDDNHHYQNNGHRLTVTPDIGTSSFGTGNCKHKARPIRISNSNSQITGMLSTNRLGSDKFMTLPSIVTPKVFAEKDPAYNDNADKGIFTQKIWRQEGSWQ